MSVVFKKMRAGLLGIVLSQMAGASGVGESYAYVGEKIGLRGMIMVGGNTTADTIEPFYKEAMKRLKFVEHGVNRYRLHNNGNGLYMDNPWNIDKTAILQSLADQVVLLREFTAQYTKKTLNAGFFPVDTSKKLEAIEYFIDGIDKKTLTVDQVLVFLLYDRLNILSEREKVKSEVSQRSYGQKVHVVNTMSRDQVQNLNLSADDPASLLYDLNIQHFWLIERLIVGLASMVDLQSLHPLVKAFILANCKLHSSLLSNIWQNSVTVEELIKTDGNNKLNQALVVKMKSILGQDEMGDYNSLFLLADMLEDKFLTTIEQAVSEHKSLASAWHNVFKVLLMDAGGSAEYSENVVKDVLQVLPEQNKKQIEALRLSIFENKSRDYVQVKARKAIEKQDSVLIAKAQKLLTLSGSQPQNKDQIKSAMEAIIAEDTVVDQIYDNFYDQFFLQYKASIMGNNSKNSSENTMDKELILLQHHNNEIDLNMSNSKPISLSSNESENISHKTNEDIPDDSCLIDSHWGDKQKVKKNKLANKHANKEFIKDKQIINTLSNVNTGLLSDNFKQLTDDIMAEFNSCKVMTYDVFNKLWKRLGGEIMSGGGGSSHKKVVNRHRKVVGGIYMHKNTEEYGPRTRRILKRILVDELERMQSIESQSV